MPEPIITTLFATFLFSDQFKELCHELARGAANGLAKGFVESMAKELLKPDKSSSGSSSIVQQSKEQVEWIQAQSEYLKRREEREKLGLVLQYQDLQDRRELARLQRELMQKLHAEAIEVKLTEIEAMWDLEKGFSKLSRKDIKDILCEEQQQFRLLVLASPPKISKSCPESFHEELEGDIRNDVKEFLHQYYPLNQEMGNLSPCPVKFNGDNLQIPIFDTEVEQFHKWLGVVPTVVLYSEVREYKVNFHIGYWGLYNDQVSLLPIKAWNWKQAWQELKGAKDVGTGGRFVKSFHRLKHYFGHTTEEDESLLIIRQVIVMVHKLLAAFVADLYYLYIDATASYEPRLFEFKEEFAQECFPQELLRDFIEILREVQQQRREVYQAELERLRRQRLRLEMLPKFTPMDTPKTGLGLPVTIITGLLGSGKTTLLNHIISNQKGLKTAVLVSEFGEISLYNCNELTEKVVPVYCAKCEICESDENTRLIDAVYQVLERDEKIDYIILETTGLADPLPIILTFLATDFKDLTSLDSVITVVDCANYSIDLFDSEAAFKQIEYGDIILFNKVDLVDEEDVDLLERKVREIKKDARIIRTKNAQVSLPLILSVGLFDSDKYYQPPQELQSHKEEHYHHNDRCSCYYLEHDGFYSFSFQSDRPFSVVKFQEDFLDELNKNIFRVKGILWFQESELRHIFHLSGKRYDMRVDEWKGKRKNQLVLICQKLEYDKLCSNLENCLV